MQKVVTDIILTQKDFVEYMEHSNKLLVFDSEDMGLNIEAPIIGFSFYDFSLNPVFAVTDNLFKEGMPQEEFVEVCNEFFPQKKAIGHNIKFDLGVTKYNGIVDIPLEADTSSMVHLHNPDLPKKLEKRVKDDLGYSKPTYEEIMTAINHKLHPTKSGTPKKIKWPKTISEWHRYVKEGIITLESMGEYAGDDAYWTGKLYLLYKDLMTEDDNKIMELIEVPLIYTLRDMHHRGVNIDLKVLEDLDVKLDAEINRLQETIYEKTGTVFNLNSPKQVGEVLYDKLKYPVLGETASGNRATGAPILKKLAAKGYDVAQDMVEHSQATTLSTSFVKSIPKLIDSDGRLRCSFTIDVARTGRLSSNSPNLQNQPNNKKFPVRKAYIPSEGCKLIVADLSQIELRMMAHVSGDKAFHKAFWSGKDIHQSVADSLGVLRKEAKILNFAIIYGMGSMSLADSLGCSLSRAKQIIEGYKATYYGFYRWKHFNEQKIIRERKVHNIFGRVRLLPQAKDPSMYWDAFLKGNNAVIQGSAAELIKIAMNKVHGAYLERKMKSQLLLSVHDELVVDSPYNEIEEAQKILVYSMEHAVKLTVPVIAECKVCNTWSDMKDDAIKSLLPQFNNKLFPIHLLT